MVIKDQVILHCAQYASPYKSNFIESLISLEMQLKEKYGATMAFVFPKRIVSQPWWTEFSRNHRCFTTVDNLEKSVKELITILQEVHPIIVHTHFDGYDIPVRKAIDRLDYQPGVVWHLHDSLWFQKNPLKAVYQVFCFFRHYNWYAQNIAIIAVSPQILHFVTIFKKLTGSSFRLSSFLPNGVDCRRLKSPSFYKTHTPFTFFAFGSRNIQKRIDLLVAAAKEVRKTIDINVVITEGVDTRDVVSSLFEESIPQWCRLVPQTDDISSLFAQADCFVSSSLFEGFPYAICEAEMYGLPVIQSNIEGTKWNEANPSVLSFESGNANDLSEKMKTMIKICIDSGLVINKKITETREVIVKKYSLTNWVTEVISFYQQL